MPSQPTPQSEFRQSKRPWMLLALSVLLLGGALLWIRRPAQETSVSTPAPALALSTPSKPLPKAAVPSPKSSTVASPALPLPLPDPAPARDFQRWLQHYAADRPDMRSLGEAPRLADRRRSVLLDLIQRAPEQALSLAVPPGLRPALPPELQERLEKWVEGNARITSLGPNRWQATLEGRTYEAYFAGTPPSPDQPQTPLPIVGIALEGHLAIAATPWRVIEPGEPDHDDAQ